MVAFLIRGGANLEFSTPREVRNEVGEIVVKKGRRPVHAAVLARDVAPLRLLLEAGASPSSTDSEGHTPLAIATP